MLSSVFRTALPVLLVFNLCMAVAQDPKPQDIETVKIDTDLVTVPVIATDVGGLYIGDMKPEEFAVTEDGVAQKIEFFGKVSLPFHVVLMLDTSSSTQDKLRLIQNAAFAFVQQLQPADRVKVITFDDEVRDLNEFTSNRETLRTAINTAKAGQGTRVYDAFEVALDTLRRIQGRKAIVIFTDGMDWHSDGATFASNIRWLDEEGVIVYPIRFDTRATTERLAREQASEPALPTLSVIRQAPPRGGTAPTFPGEDPVPTSAGSNKTGPFGLPSADEIMRRRREEERRRQPDPRPGDPVPDPPQQRIPDQGVPRLPGSTTTTIPGSTTTSTSTSRRSADDSIGRMLDVAYDTADSYLKALADKSGGRLLRADTINSLPDAFAQIAAELRTQYLIGYYPTNKDRDERYRKIKVTTVRKNVVIRARPGYTATAAR